MSCAGAVCTPVGLGFLLGGVPYPNNSVVALRDIGNNTMDVGSALYCLTTRTSCCRDLDGESAGAWFLPGQTDPVPAMNSEAGHTADFSRGRAPSAVYLNHRNSTTGPSGVYTCEIPDASGQLQTLYIGVDTGTVM